MFTDNSRGQSCGRIPLNMASRWLRIKVFRTPRGRFISKNYLYKYNVQLMHQRKNSRNLTKGSNSIRKHTVVDVDPYATLNECSLPHEMRCKNIHTVYEAG